MASGWENVESKKWSSDSARLLKHGFPLGFFSPLYSLVRLSKSKHLVCTGSVSRLEEMKD